MIVKNFTFKPSSVNINRINVEAHVRYWTDCRINGQEFDEDDPNVTSDMIKDLLTRWDPKSETGLVAGDKLILNIDPDSGKVMNYWGEREIEMFFKVCDECSWNATTRKHNGPDPRNWYDEVVVEEEEDYVPDFLSLDDEGYGDYILITIDKDGFIKEWPSPNRLSDMISDYSSALNIKGDD